LPIAHVRNRDKREIQYGDRDTLDISKMWRPGEELRVFGPHWVVLSFASVKGLGPRVRHVPGAGTNCGGAQPFSLVISSATPLLSGGCEQGLTLKISSDETWNSRLKDDATDVLWFEVW